MARTRWVKCEGCLCDGCTKNCYKNEYKAKGVKYGCGPNAFNTDRKEADSCSDRRRQCNETEITERVA